ncbi:MAG: hypothetical protein NTV36_00860 [Candidatus Staskawiczbacteria bacterium]|nr:hypothetical protein [Candidatus Staskawiczbacteria bacterium]
MLTIALVRELDNLRDATVREVLCEGEKYKGPLPFILDPHCEDQLPALARKWGVPLHILAKYQVLCEYIDQTAQYCLDEELALSPEEFAADLGMDFSELEPYITGQVLEIRHALEEDRDENALQASEIAGRGLSRAEWESYLNDLRQDTGVTCD